MNIFFSSLFLWSEQQPTAPRSLLCSALTLKNYEAEKALQRHITWELKYDLQLKIHEEKTRREAELHLWNIFIMWRMCVICSWKTLNVEDIIHQKISFIVVCVQMRIWMIENVKSSVEFFYYLRPWTSHVFSRFIPIHVWSFFFKWSSIWERWKRALSVRQQKYYVLRQILYHLWYSYHNNTYNVDSSCFHIISTLSLLYFRIEEKRNNVKLLKNDGNICCSNWAENVGDEWARTQHKKWGNTMRISWIQINFLLITYSYIPTE